MANKLNIPRLSNMAKTIRILSVLGFNNLNQRIDGPMYLELTDWIVHDDLYAPNSLGALPAIVERAQDCGLTRFLLPSAMQELWRTDRRHSLLDTILANAVRDRLVKFVFLHGKAVARGGEYDRVYRTYDPVYDWTYSGYDSASGERLFTSTTYSNKRLAHAVAIGDAGRDGYLVLGVDVLSQKGAGSMSPGSYLPPVVLDSLYDALLRAI